MVDNSMKWLITLSHAGGSSAIFKRWNRAISCNVLNIEYPGHLTRLNESLINSFDELVADVIIEIKKKVPEYSEIYIFGHSMGAIIAWDIVPKLVNNDYTVKALFLSGSHNPGAFPEESIKKTVSDYDMLKLIGYNPRDYDDIINQHFMEIFLPILKNDLDVCKSFVSDGHFVDVDSYLLYGNKDPFTKLDEIIKWKDFVKTIDCLELSGEHIFINDKENLNTIVELINKVVESVY